MKKVNWILTIAVVMASCSAPKVLVSHKQLAESAAKQGNHLGATDEWNRYFTETQIDLIDGATFAEAARSALLSGNHSQSVSWFDQARYKGFSSAPMYADLAEIFRLQKNISKELTALEFYAANFSENLTTINSRLFDIYSEIGETGKALATWNTLTEEQRNTTARLNSFFLANKKMKQNEACDSVSAILLAKDPANIDALQWNAEKYYWQAENRYQAEMEKYEKNKSNKQYKILLGQLDLVTADFKKSLTYLEKLWAIEPGEKYASYFANIYARFGDEKNASRYKEYLKK